MHQQATTLNYSVTCPHLSARVRKKSRVVAVINFNLQHPRSKPRGNCFASAPEQQDTRFAPAGDHIELLCSLVRICPHVSARVRKKSRVVAVINFSLQHPHSKRRRNCFASASEQQDTRLAPAGDHTELLCHLSAFVRTCPQEIACSCSYKFQFAASALQTAWKLLCQRT